ncbi:Imm50 family immunity protein [Streptomyces sp. NPDC101151]|uniref:Imm50 family immunity protein n=1 Tax=Streptomyces sp. NPDC101151 TaxID=3366115 RepID=UPI00382A886F
MGFALPNPAKGAAAEPWRWIAVEPGCCRRKREGSGGPGAGKGLRPLPPSADDPAHETRNSRPRSADTRQPAQAPRAALRNDVSATSGTDCASSSRARDPYETLTCRSSPGPSPHEPGFVTPASRFRTPRIRREPRVSGKERQAWTWCPAVRSAWSGRKTSLRWRRNGCCSGTGAPGIGPGRLHDDERCRACCPRAHRYTPDRVRPWCAGGAECRAEWSSPCHFEQRSTDIATPTWDSLLCNPEHLTDYYTAVPPLEQVPLRSVHLSPHGPTLKLRIELPWFADTPPPGWAEAGCDRLECQVGFLATDDLHMRGLPAGQLVNLVHSPLGQRRLSVSVLGDAVQLEFTCADALQVSHVSAYRAEDGDPYRARRWFRSPVDQRLPTTLPDPTRKTFYDNP